MFRPSNKIVAILNLVLVVISLITFVIGAVLSARKSACDKSNAYSLIGSGVTLFTISLLGFIGSCYRKTCAMITYLIFMLLTILFTFIFIIFSLVVSKKGAGHAVANQTYKEYRLADYHHALVSKVTDDWKAHRSCLQDNKACKRVAKSTTLSKMKLTPIESGCCKPPSECGFTYVNATVWSKPETGFNFNNQDCSTWSNDTTCLDCQSCKAGMVETMKGSRKSIAIFNVFVLILLVIVYALGCCAFRNNRRESHGTLGHP